MTIHIRSFRRSHAAFGTAIVALVLATTGSVSQGAGKPKLQRADLEVVDCLLPGQVRVLGTRTYLTQRRPVKTTASDCRLRGGEYVDFDRANMKTALNVWMEAAQAGDAEAQNNVGEIFERGLGEEPNYEAAATWYQKAVDQGYTRAMFNLGTLYEQGQGVPADKLRALNLYRQSWGMPEDSVIYQSAAAEEINTLRAELDQQVKDKDDQLKRAGDADGLAAGAAGTPKPPRRWPLPRRPSLAGDRAAEPAGGEPEEAGRTTWKPTVVPAAQRSRWLTTTTVRTPGAAALVNAAATSSMAARRRAQGTGR